MPSGQLWEYASALWLRRPLARLGGGRNTMAKDQDIKKSSNKKAPQKTLKEKRAAKKAKKAEKA